MTNRPKFNRSTVVAASCLTAPAFRMVHITAWADDTGADHEFFPVVAVESRIVNSYTRRRRDENDYGVDCLTHEEHLEAGYDFEGQESELRPIILDPDYGLIAINDELVTDVVNAACRTVCAPWPQSEDDMRLADIVEQIKREAAAKFIRDREQKEKQTRTTNAQGFAVGRRTSKTTPNLTPSNAGPHAAT